MKILAINYATDVEASVRFYKTLGLDLAGEHDPVWTEMKASGGTFAIHSHGSANRPRSGFEICMVAERPLESIQQDLVSAGFEAGRIVEEDFGRSLRVVDPDGNELQINDR